MKVADLATISAALAGALALAVAATASAQGMPDGTKVRIVASGLGSGWLDGKLR